MSALLQCVGITRENYMAYDVKETASFPVNELGEVVVQYGKGTTSVVGVIPSCYIPVDPDTNKMVIKLPQSPTTSGFIDYNDTATIATPLNIVANTWTTIPNNGLGVNTNKLYKPSGITEFLDVNTGRVLLSELSLGDVVFLRPDFIVNPNTANSQLEFRFFIGQTGQEYSLAKRFPKLDSGNIEYPMTLDTYEIYIGDNNTRIGGLLMQVRLSVAGTLKNNGVVITAFRRVIS
jgi:hypothetical protein